MIRDQAAAETAGAELVINPLPDRAARAVGYCTEATRSLARGARRDGRLWQADREARGGRRQVEQVGGARRARAHAHVAKVQVRRRQLETRARARARRPARRHMV